MLSNRGSGKGSRIRPPRRSNLVPDSPADDFDSNWDKLRAALHDIHTKNASGLAFEMLYRHAYKIVLKKAGDRLYAKVKEFEEGWFQKEVIPPINALITESLITVTFANVASTSVVERRATGEKFLRAIRDAWEEHNLAMNMVADILMYLDRGHNGQVSSTKPSIFATTIGLFRDQILQALAGQSGCRVFDIFNATIIDQINMEREGDAIDKALLRSCVGMLEQLHQTDEEKENEKLYLTVFEPEYLRSSHAFYNSECENLLREANAAHWLRHTERRLHEEADRCNTTLSYTTLDKITQVVRAELITAHLEDFMGLDGTGFNAMMDNGRHDDLATLYRLVSQTDPKRMALCDGLAARILELGEDIAKTLWNTDFSTPKEADEAGDTAGTNSGKVKKLNASAQQTAAAVKWVDEVLVLKDKFDYLLAHCFTADKILDSHITKSFADLINKFDRAPEFLSLFIDDALKRRIQSMTETEVDGVLTKAISVLRYISARDLFEEYYQRHLARRLLHQKSESESAEMEMITRMKRELGSSFTTRFDGMFKDMRVSQEKTEAYRQHVRGLGAAREKQVDFNIHIIAANFWPRDMSRLAMDVNYPPVIRSLQESFSTFYNTEHTGRKLKWLAKMGTADIRCVFPKVAGKTSGPLSKERQYDFSVTTLAMTVLLLFNEVAEDQWLTVDEIQARTNIATNELLTILTSLTIMKQSKVLLKDPESKAHAAAGDKFSFNRHFVSKTVKIKMTTVNNSSRVELEEERKVSEDRAMETRRYVIDAAVVRIMKQRKELLHAQLMSEVIEQLKGQFQPDIALIKGRIVMLIDREYLERCDDKPGYRYLA